MFSVYNRDLPEVEVYILDKLDQRELLHSKQVCKSWAVAVRRYIGMLSAERISDLMKSALQETVPIYGIVDLPQPVRDLTINESKQGGNSISLYLKKVLTLFRPFCILAVQLLKYKAYTLFNFQLSDNSLSYF